MLRARQWHGRDTEFANALDDRVDLALRRVALHDDEHYGTPSGASPGISSGVFYLHGDGIDPKKIGP